MSVGGHGLVAVLLLVCSEVACDLLQGAALGLGHSGEEEDEGEHAEAGVDQVPSRLIAPTSVRKNEETRKLALQLPTVERLIAGLRTLSGNISEIIGQNTGPRPTSTKRLRPLSASLRKSIVPAG